MLGKLILFFTIIPTIELIILIALGNLIGFWPTVAIIIFTGILGALLTKIQGLSVLKQITFQLRNSSLPGQKIVEGVLILIAGAMLITPGILTDITGFLLLIPVTRAFFRDLAIVWLKRKLLKGSFLSNIKIW